MNIQYKRARNHAPGSFYALKYKINAQMYQQMIIDLVERGELKEEKEEIPAGLEDLLMEDDVLDFMDQIDPETGEIIG